MGLADSLAARMVRFRERIVIAQVRRWARTVRLAQEEFVVVPANYEKALLDAIDQLDKAEAKELRVHRSK